MEKVTLTFITGNENKRIEVEEILNQSKITLKSKKLDLPELQGKRTEIASQKCVRAAEIGLSLTN